MLSFRKCPAFDAVSAGRKAVMTIEPGLRVHRVSLIVGNAAVAANDLDNGDDTSDLLDDIVVKYKAKPQRIFTPAQLNRMNSLNGAEYGIKSVGTAGQADRFHRIDIWFANPWRLTAAERVAPAWNLAKEGIQIEVNIKAGLAAPTLEAEMEVDALTQDDIGAIQKVYREDISAVGSTKKIQTLAKADLIEAIHFLPTVGGTSRYVSAVKLQRNGYDDIDNISLTSMQASLTGWGLNPDSRATPWYELVLDRSDRMQDGMVAEGLRTLHADVTFSGAAAGVLPVIIQRTGAPD
ncbi:MAG: hypothetical protein SFU86_00025 [Pirellulaceae bacterium]|nr:hypothetical protein [Pirellulaceae bacterium]